MTDVIERQAAIDAVGINTWAGQRLLKVPSAQRTGRWIDDELMCKARCSVCGEEFSWMDNDMDRFWFCPNCGSYNGGEDE